MGNTIHGVTPHSFGACSRAGLDKPSRCPLPATLNHGQLFPPMLRVSCPVALIPPPTPNLVISACNDSGLISPPALTTPVISILWVQSLGQVRRTVRSIPFPLFLEEYIDQVTTKFEVIPLYIDDFLWFTRSSCHRRWLIWVLPGTLKLYVVFITSARASQLYSTHIFLHLRVKQSCVKWAACLH